MQINRTNNPLKIKDSIERVNRARRQFGGYTVGLVIIEQEESKREKRN